MDKKEKIKPKNYISNSNKIGLWSSSALVVGNMVGSGIFLLPASLATYGGTGRVGWVCSALGAVRLSKELDINFYKLYHLIRELILSLKPTLKIKTITQ